MNETVYNNVFPVTADVEVVKNLYREFYTRTAPILHFKVFDPEATRKVAMAKTYHEARTEDRRYSLEVDVHILGPFDPYMAEVYFWGLDPTRSLVFTCCMPIMEDLGVTPKVGDVLVFNGIDNELLTAKAKPESYFAHSNYALEMILATQIPNVGS